MKKAVEKVNKHNFNGRPLKVKEVSLTANCAVHLSKETLFFGMAQIDCI